jgi:hypothetical protein
MVRGRRGISVLLLSFLGCEEDREEFMYESMKTESWL